MGCLVGCLGEMFEDRLDKERVLESIESNQLAAGLP